MKTKLIGLDMYAARLCVENAMYVSFLKETRHVKNEFKLFAYQFFSKNILTSINSAFRIFRYTV